MPELKDTRRQIVIQKKHCTGQKRSKKKTKILLGQNFTNLEHDTYRTQTKLYKILKKISENVKKQHVFKET
jgi:hypothetical protein